MFILNNFSSLNIISQIFLIFITSFSIHNCYYLLKEIFIIKFKINKEKENIFIIEEKCKINCSTLHSTFIYLNCSELFTDFTLQKIEEIDSFFEKNKKNVKERIEYFERCLLYYFYSSISFLLLGYYFYYFDIVILEITICCMMFLKFLLYLLTILNNQLMSILKAFYQESFQSFYLIDYEQRILNAKKIEKLKDIESRKLILKDITKSYDDIELDNKFIIHGLIPKRKLFITKVLKSLNKMKEYNLVFFVNKEEIDNLLSLVPDYLTFRSIMILQDNEKFYKNILSIFLAFNILSKYTIFHVIFIQFCCFLYSITRYFILLLYVIYSTYFYCNNIL